MHPPSFLPSASPFARIPPVSLQCVLRAGAEWVTWEEGIRGSPRRTRRRRRWGEAAGPTTWWSWSTGSSGAQQIGSLGLSNLRSCSQTKLWFIVIEEIDRRPHIKKISFVAHSVGGLVARYAIGRLYRSPTLISQSDPQSLLDNNRGTIHGLEAVNFITVASPHLGSRGKRQVPFLFGVTAIENFACCIIHLIFGRTGKQLFLADNDDGKPPLLQRMVDDWKDLRFMSALQTFRRRVAYSNVGYDHIVGWRTSSIRRNTQLPKWVDSTSMIYPHIVYEELSKEETLNQVAATDDVDNCTIEERLLRGLKRVSWENVDASFHNSKVRYAAHSVIQVKDPVLHYEGADVIQHMIDHLIL